MSIWSFDVKFPENTLTRVFTGKVRRAPCQSLLLPGQQHPHAWGHQGDVQNTEHSPQIFLFQAKNLKSKDINGLSDPYVKVWLMFGEKRVEKKKTPIYKCNLNPTFNQVHTADIIRLLSLMINFTAI